MKFVLHTFFLLSLALLQTSLYSQGYRISGTVSDRENGEPIPFLTVYVNGTTTGTITDQAGHYELNGIMLPCDLVFSHISYALHLITIRDTVNLSDFNVHLSRKVFPLKEATVIHNSLREKYMERFRGWFLGPDYAEVNAEILNESALIFIALEEDQFEAYANEPLEIHLPETGYKLKTDLVHFKLKKKEELGSYQCSILGYFFFEEEQADSRRQYKQYLRKRGDTYYNTRWHFCRSLYDNKLEENGYLFNRNCLDEAEKEQGEFHKPDYTFWYEGEASGKILYMTNFTCPTFEVLYYHKSGNKPADLNYLYPHPSNMVRSGLLFLQDTIRIFPSGRVAENSILFDRVIGNKGVAWMLPDDYIPSMQ